MNFLRLQIIPFSLLILGLSLGCRKAGFVDESGSISIVSFYRIQDERVDYLFFELQENSETLEHSSYYYAFDHGDGTFDENATWTKLSFHEGVHQHAVISCGESKRCGSFSWPSDDTRGRIAVRMVYHPEGSAKLEDASSVKNLSTLFQSARVFGVYDAANEHVQVRIEDNFGGLQASQYGMTRRFKIHAPSAFTATSQQMKELRSSLRNNYLFPASFCPDATTSAVTKDFFGSKVWLDQVFPNIVTHSGSCMNVDFVDKNGVNLATHEAYARRNPNFKSGA
ncbi:MAG: hypothetical protein NTV34_17370, partial [Proteobacteria bacterium]|nr:hypothetical protein [Pseudomonadota bacterium]